jgi:hypothetical protein
MGPAAIFAAGNDFMPLPSKPGPFAAARTVPSANGRGTAALAAPPGPAHHCPAPKVTLQRQGDVVSSIRIQCSCGQVIELNCVY